ncbi:hypothetical protein ACIBP7_00210 [Micrococcus luteus]|uniref:hypothetical protein n=1 Tax=Micrococcus luteus TaxID=1270 RepID=UPI0037B14725
MSSHRTVKGVTGYELTARMIGTEGTLGVITQAVLALRPHVPGAVPTPPTTTPCACRRREVGASALIGEEALSSGRRSSDRSVRG